MPQVRDVECQCPEVGEDPEDEGEEVEGRVRVVHDRVSACERIQIGVGILRDEWPGIVCMCLLVVVILHDPALAAYLRTWIRRRRARAPPPPPLSLIGLA